MITTINEWKRLNESIDIVKLENELESFRKQMEDENEWTESKNCFMGTCQDVTRRLETYLKSLGYNAYRVQGYYKNAADDFYPDTSEWDYNDSEIFTKQYNRNGDSSHGLKFPHWWIELDKYIIDLTEDQFHPGEEDEYRIGLYKKPNTNYKRI